MDGGRIRSRLFVHHNATAHICADMDDIVWPSNFSSDMTLRDRYLYVRDLIANSPPGEVILWPADQLVGPVSTHPEANRFGLQAFVTFGRPLEGGDQEPTRLFIVAGDARVRHIETDVSACRQTETYFKQM